MRKILYFALFALIIIATYMTFQKQSQPNEMPLPNNIEETTAPIENEQLTQINETPNNCTCKTECICPENDPDCECKQTKTICKCTQPDGTVAVVESVDNNNEDIEELNPDETADEDETIVNE